LKYAGREAGDAPSTISSSATGGELAPKRASSRPGAWIVAAVSLAVLLLAALLVYRLAGTREPSLHFQSPSLGKLTATGNISNAAISPDGKYIVYAMDGAEKQGLWVRQVAVANSVRLIPASEVEYRGLTFSHDGNYVYYVLNERGNSRRKLY